MGRCKPKPALSGEGVLREPTASETARIDADEDLQRMIKGMRFTRLLIDKSGPGFSE
jgi:hypothetical protein